MTRTIGSLLAVSAALVACGPQATPSAPPPPAPALSAEEQRVETWLSQLTPAEKLSLVGGTGFDTVGVPRLGIPSLRMTDGPVGVRAGQSTAFPASVALAATFDPALIERVGGALGREAKAKGKNVLLGPCVNIQRAPQGGRNFESFGEDPYLAARAAVAYIRGVQRQGVIATVKHFAANNQETERHTINVVVDERTLHEIYFPAFEAAVKEAGVKAVMCSYNKLNGPWACESPGLLTGVLEQRWGFTGLVMSDWEATHSVAPSVRAGLDLEMPKGTLLSPAHLEEALAQGAVPAAAIDEMVRRQLRVIASMGLADAPSTTPAQPVDPPENRALAREVASSAFVLLKNEGSLLPLDRAKLKRLAVIGPRAAWVDGGGGSARVTPVRAVSLLAALREALGPAVQVDYAPGGFAPESLEVVPAQALSPPPGEGSGPGLLGAYYVGTEHAGAPRLQRIDPTVDFDFHLDGPAKGFPVDDFSIIWRGRLTAPETGRYLIALASDDGSRLYLDGKLVVDDWGQHPVVLKWSEIELEAGRPHDLRLEYYETILGASVRLLWKKEELEPADHVRAAAKAADAVIVYVGDTDLDETEGADRPGLTLPGNQEDLVRAALAANPRTVVIVGTGAPVLMGSFLPGAPAVVQAWFAGEEAGPALASVLLGDVSPSGKLPATFPKRWEDSPAYGNFPGSGGEVHYAEGLLVGYRHFDTRHVTPEFPFGHGLSYTTFAYRDLVASAPDAQRRVDLRLLVKNTGARRGAEVVQVYVHALTMGETPKPTAEPVDPRLARPEQALAGFSKVDLAPGEEREVRLTLEPRAFSVYDTARHDWALERGRFEIRVGSSSRDIRARAVVALE